MRCDRFVLALLALPAATLGQQTFFVQPEAARLAPGAALRVRLESGGKAAPWDGVRWIYVRVGDAQENLDVPPNAPDAGGLVTLPCPGSGPTVVGVDLRPVVEEMDAAALRAFAAAKCDGALPVDVAGKVRVRHIRSCKALLRVGDGPGAAAIAKSSQGAEIAVWMDPTRAPVGSDVAFAVVIAGAELGDARVVATPGAGRVQDVRSKTKSPGHFTITTAGPWRVESHHLARADPGSGADWILTSATLTFTVPEGKP